MFSGNAFQTFLRERSDLSYIETWESTDTVRYYQWKPGLGVANIRSPAASYYSGLNVSRAEGGTIAPSRRGSGIWPSDYVQGETVYCIYDYEWCIF
jgi:hypothetical protein